MGRKYCLFALSILFIFYTSCQSQKAAHRKTCRQIELIANKSSLHLKDILFLGLVSDTSPIFHKDYYQTQKEIITQRHLLRLTDIDAKWDDKTLYQELDFCLSCVSNRYAREKTSKFIQRNLELHHRIILDLYCIYWKCAAAKYGAERLELLMYEIQALSDHNREIFQLQHNKKIAELKENLLQYQERYENFMRQLCVRLPISTFPALSIPEIIDTKAQELSLQQLQIQAFYNRPEIYEWAKNKEATYFAQIECNHLSSIESAMHLLSFASQSHTLESEEVFPVMSIAVLSQVSLGYATYLKNVSQLWIKKELLEVKKDLLDTLKQSEKIINSSTDILDATIQSAWAEIELYTQHSEIQICLATLAHSIGLPLLFSEIDLSEILQQAGQYSKNCITLTNFCAELVKSSKSVRKYKHTKGPMQQISTAYIDAPFSPWKNENAYYFSIPEEEEVAIKPKMHPLTSHLAHSGHIDKNYYIYWNAK